MQITNITRQQNSITTQYISFTCSPDHSKEIWLFNCNEGCQHNLGVHKIKLNQISKIIITSLNIHNISGLLGLLSSLSLISRNKNLNIYSPQNLEKYLKLGKKYSQTNFRYNIHFHILKTGLVINHNLYQVYAYQYNFTFDLSIITKEKFGKFKLLKAQHFHLIEGPLYGRLKENHDVISPDGLIVNNKDFKYANTPRKKISLMSSIYNRRNSIEISNKSQILKHSLQLFNL